ncbi:MAG: carboxypeptidase regulatory-like domain-containing protein [Mycobacterium sp.]|nr:carboxypeptidase regulatory-like domain-containing protein [Mycobacterium sp.]
MRLGIGNRSRTTWLVVAAAAVAAVATIGTAVGATPSHPGKAAAAAQPKLTTNTPAPCNAPPKPGHFQCFAVVRTPADHEITPDTSGPPAGSLGPADIQSAYNLPSGGGQTVAIVDWGDDATAESDLATFRAQFGLPPCSTANGCFTKVNQQGQQGNYPPDQGSGLEISLDVDAVSAACPGCNILLVEANSSSIDDTGASVVEAVSLGAKYVSNSYGLRNPGEVDGETSYDHYYDQPGVAVVVSSGDVGNQAAYPSTIPNVVSAGGTTLTKDNTVSRGWDESAWNSGGSGCSQFEPQPSFQGGIAALDAVCPDNRATADISADADPASGLAVFDSNPNDGVGGWIPVGGTSLSSPLIAATYALAGTPAPGTYPVTYPYQDPKDLNDVTTGSNGSCASVLCNAGPGWDGPTGLGTPDGVTALQGAPQGTITGQVTDSSTGKPIAGARVTASPGSSGATTDANGNYDLTGLAVGTYTLTATAAAYNQASQTGVQVTVGQSTTANLALIAQGSITGQVTDSSTGNPIAGAKLTLSPGDAATTTDSSGDYTVKALPAGTYTLTVSDYSYTTRTITGVTVADQTTTTENVALTRAAVTAVSGTVTDGSGHGWPLYAKVSVDGDPDGPVFTDPATGKFGLTLPNGSQTFHVTPLYPGYQPATQTVQLDQPNQAVDLTAHVDATSCAAPGYGPNGLSTDFLGWSGDTAQNGWAVTGGKQGWRFDDPGNRQWPLGGDDNFAIADSAYAGNQKVNATLTSPTVELSGQTSPTISFDTHYVGASGQSASVEVSTDSGRYWSTLWHQSDGFASSQHVGAIAPIHLPLPVKSGPVRVRFSFTGRGGGYWEIDNVLIGSDACVAQPGGLIVGNATDAGTGADLPGVTISRTTDPAHPAITAATPDDPKLADGFYWLFAPGGADPMTASDEGYATAGQTVSVKADRVVTHDWALKAN